MSLFFFFPPLISNSRMRRAAPQALFALLAAFAAAFGFLFRTLTQITQAGRKRKRSLAGTSAPSFGEDNWWEELKNHLGDQFYHGNFENTFLGWVERLKSGIVNHPMGGC